MYTPADTLDDLMGKVFQKLLKIERSVSPTRGENREICGALLRIKKPRARLSHSETREVLFSCLGELFWYLSGSNSLKFIEYYIPRYKGESRDGITVDGAYGPRLYQKDGTTNQIKNVIELLQERPTTRRAVIQLFDAKDIDEVNSSVPCTCTLQFMIRDNVINMYTHMRSNDAFMGLPHDVFAFTMLQEILANILNVKIGTYTHSVNSLHLYSKHVDKARQYIEEGWQGVETMPAMPQKDVMLSLKWIQSVEERIREKQAVDIEGAAVADYWKDIARLLLIFSHFKKGEWHDLKEIVRIQGLMSTDFYEKYIRTKRALLAKRVTPTQQKLPLDTFEQETSPTL